MKKLLLWLLPILLTGCFSVRGIHYAPVGHADYWIAEPAWLHATPDTTSHLPLYLDRGKVARVIGQHGPWAVIRCQGQRYFVWGRWIGEPVVYGGYGGYAGGGGVLYVGPRGGEYYYNGNGNRTYITPQSTIDTRIIETGPRGGQYYINDNGNKTYIKR